MITLSRAKISVPIGTILPWVKRNRVTNSTTYGTYVDCSGLVNKVGFSITGQDLIDVGIDEGSTFDVQTEIKKVIIDQWVNTAYCNMYADPNTIVANASISSGTSIATMGTGGTSWGKSSIVTTTAYPWVASTNFAISYNTERINSSREGYCQFRNFSYLHQNNNELPGQFVECDGSVISDSSSPFDGETLPDLNTTQRFLKGDDTTYTTGGSDTHNHSFIFPTTYRAYTGGGSNSPAPGYPTYAVTYYTDTSSNLPPYVELNYIIRIK